MPQSNPNISSDAPKNKFQVPTSQSSSSFSSSSTTITLSNKQCSQTRHSSTTKLIPSSIIKTQCHNLDKHNGHKQRHSSTNIIPSSIIKTQCHNLDKSNNSSQSNKRESISQAHPQAPSSKTQYHKSNTTISYDTQKTNSKFPISDVVTQLKDPTPPPPPLPHQPKNQKTKNKTKVIFL